MPSDLQRVAQSLVECLDEMPNLVAHLQRLAAKCRENASMIADFGSANSSARTAALQLDAAAQACERAAHMASLASPMARQWAEQMVSGVRAADSRPRSRERGRSEKPSLSEAALKLLGKLPTRAKDGKTRGFRVGGDVDMPELISGHDDYQQKAREFIFDHKLGPEPHHRLAIESHVEVKFAMMIRERGLTNETIVINNVPCDIPYGCKRYLSDILPPGARLTVVAPGFHDTFIGREDQ
jgi:hypothetical protein